MSYDDESECVLNEYSVTLYVRTPYTITVKAVDEEGAEQSAMAHYRHGGEFSVDRAEIDSAETDVMCVRNNVPEVDDDPHEFELADACGDN